MTARGELMGSVTGAATTAVRTRAVLRKARAFLTARTASSALTASMPAASSRIASMNQRRAERRWYVVCFEYTLLPRMASHLGADSGRPAVDRLSRTAPVPPLVPCAQPRPGRVIWQMYRVERVSNTVPRFSSGIDGCPVHLLPTHAVKPRGLHRRGRDSDR